MTEPASPRVAPRTIADTGGAQAPAWLFSAALGLILAAAAGLRFYGLSWGAPYFHFHIDEHFVFMGAERLRVSMEAAAKSGKFFMYSPLPMHALNAIVWVYEAVKGPLVLTRFGDQVTYMILGRAISAALGTATVLVTWFVGRKVAGRLAGLVAAALMATFVLHISETHSFRVDGTMIFFVALAWLFALRIVEAGRWPDYLWAGVFAGAAIGSKYSAAFVLGVIALAHLASPRRPASWRDVRGWAAWTARGASPLVVALLTFAAVDPMAILYYDKFRQDIAEQITTPLTGAVKPIWIAQFRDVQPQLYWLTNLWWGMGPAMEIWGLVGVVWLALRRTRVAFVAAAFPVVYFLTAGGTVAPMARYILPLGPGLAVAAGALSAGLISRPRWRPWAVAATVIVVGSTSLYAAAYMNIYASKDVRLVASKYLWSTVPAGSRILVEPAHSIPPTGTYLTAPDFFGDYVMWGKNAERRDYYQMYGLDTYVYLYRGRGTDEEKRAYIASRLGLVDYILMDDFYLQLYQHLPESDYGVVKQYYRDLFDGRLGFELVKTFKAYPSLFGITINDDGAELSSRMNDHPRIYLFKRRGVS
jgi:4-amino-4-deoxy-L-arabinose transferase-like glycosyltransferase